LSATVTDNLVCTFVLFYPQFNTLVLFLKLKLILIYCFLVNEKCGIVKDSWCGWKRIENSGSQWQRGTADDMIQMQSKIAVINSMSSSKSGNIKSTR
jgi:hypothetical protein